MWCHGHSHCTTGVAAVVFVLSVGCSCYVCTVYGIVAAVVCATCESQLPSLCYMGVTVMVVMLYCVVVMVAIVEPRGATAVVIVVTSSLDHKRES